MRAVLIPVVLGSMAASDRRPAFIAPGDWAAAVGARGVDPARYADPLALTPAMRQAAREYAGAGDVLARLDRLQQSLFDPARYTFEYDSDRTLTAGQAFEARRGNCVSFVNLFIALARAEDIPVRPAVLRHVRDVELEGDLLVVNTHLVAVLEGPGRPKVFDFYRSRADVPVAVRVLDDLDLNAIYLNNLGVEELRSDLWDRAVSYFEAAIALSPEFAEAYANLGVGRRRMGDERGALDAYFAGLALAPSNRQLLNNLTTLYRTRERAAGVETGSRPHGSAPVTAGEMLARADLEMARGNLERAKAQYERAHRMDRSLAEPLVGIGRLQILSGKPKLARRTLARALQADPGDVAARELLGYLDRGAPASAR